jgi:hypothetical protein
MLKRILISIFLFIGQYQYLLVSSYTEDSFPTCGDCWCVPGNNGLDACPYDEKPITEYPDTSIQIYMQQMALNSYTINCNPYKDKSCQTSPPQIFLDSDKAVCAFVYPADQCSTYSIQTFASREDAEVAGAVITHEGSCGLCSTTIDLALYLSKF